MTSTPSRLDLPQYKQCPTCRRLTPAESPRCHECWNDVANVPVMPPHEGIRAIARQTSIDLAQRAVIERRKAFWRRTRKVAIAFASGVLTVVVYFGFIYSPPPPPPGRDPSIQMTFGAATWPIDGGDLGGTRVAGTTPRLDAAAAWTQEVGAAPRVPLIAGPDLVYAALTDGRVVAIEAATGREAWAVVLPNPPVAAPTLAGNRLLIPQLSGRLLVLDANTGAVVLETGIIPVSFTTSPMVADGVVYLFGTGALVAVDATTGGVLWTQRVDSNWAFVTPVLAGPYVAAATGDRTLIFDRRTGQQTYFYEFRRAQPYSIAVVDDTVYSLSSRFGAAIEVTSERPWWEGWRKYWNQFFIWGMAPEPPPPPSLWVTSRPPRDGFPVAVGTDRLLVAGPTGDLRAISRTDGSPLWRQQVDPIVTPPVLTPGGLLIVHAGGLALHNPDDGALLSGRMMDGPGALKSAIITSHGTYVIDDTGLLTALR